MIVVLTDAQRAQIKEACETRLKHGDPVILLDIIQVVYPGYDGRGQEGKAVKKEMARLGVDFATSQFTRKPKRLTPEQKLLIDNNVNDVPNVFELTKMVTGEEEPTKEAIEAVEAHIKTMPQDVIQQYEKDTEDPKSVNYKAPKSLSTAIQKVNRYCSMAFKEENMKDDIKGCMMRLIKYLNSHRFVTIIETYERKSDRDMFESQFVSHVWDKPDLVPEELNLYVNLCTEYVQQTSLQRQITMLDKMMEDKARDPDGAQLSMSLAENISVKTKEMNECKNRQKQLISDLIGKRSRRVETQTMANRSFLNVVKAFMDEKERQRMLDMAERRRKLVSNEIDKYEDMEAYFARIMGITREEVLN